MSLLSAVSPLLFLDLEVLVGGAGDNEAAPVFQEAGPRHLAAPPQPQHLQYGPGIVAVELVNVLDGASRSPLLASDEDEDDSDDDPGSIYSSPVDDGRSHDDQMATNGIHAYWRPEPLGAKTDPLATPALQNAAVSAERALRPPLASLPWPALDPAASAPGDLAVPPELSSPLPSLPAAAGAGNVATCCALRPGSRRLLLALQRHYTVVAFSHRGDAWLQEMLEVVDGDRECLTLRASFLETSAGGGPGESLDDLLGWPFGVPAIIVDGACTIPLPGLHWPPSSEAPSAPEGPLVVTAASRELFGCLSDNVIEVMPYHLYDGPYDYTVDVLGAVLLGSSPTAALPAASSPAPASSAAPAAAAGGGGCVGPARCCRLRATPAVADALRRLGLGSPEALLGCCSMLSSPFSTTGGLLAPTAMPTPGLVLAPVTAPVSLPAPARHAQRRRGRNAHTWQGPLRGLAPIAEDGEREEQEAEMPRPPPSAASSGRASCSDSSSGSGSGSGSGSDGGSGGRSGSGNGNDADRLPGKTVMLAAERLLRGQQGYALLPGGCFGGALLASTGGGASASAGGGCFGGAVLTGPQAQDSSSDATGAPQRSLQPPQSPQPFMKGARDSNGTACSAGGNSGAGSDYISAAPLSSSSGGGSASALSSPSLSSALLSPAGCSPKEPPYARLLPLARVSTCFGAGPTEAEQGDSGCGCGMTRAGSAPAGRTPPLPQAGGAGATASSPGRFKFGRIGICLRPSVQ
ncbi:hypothetical protein HYH03_011529 [Edaphochlamys debaryana]|uniref:Uncharacterized protein n=1 Tax=Edaphochlamys debaryana TaxID=47281 RepID=A0A835XUL4_9CHLO|nr:hypothetical protein HYH03_011529 [Edaphochlamys debaryana]|eukprot:KAG2490064.1 hypothetical protein HYH03_011529 [Edaphochlamys debaryana]